MENKDAIAALAALTQTTRLEMFRLLVKHEPHGVAAGEIAPMMNVPPEHGVRAPGNFVPRRLSQERASQPNRALLGGPGWLE